MAIITLKWQHHPEEHPSDCIIDSSDLYLFGIFITFSIRSKPITTGIIMNRM